MKSQCSTRKEADFTLKVNGLGINVTKSEGVGASSLNCGFELNLQGLKERFEPSEVTTTIQVTAKQRQQKIIAAFPFQHWVFE